MMEPRETPHLDVIIDPIVDMVSGKLAGVEAVHVCSPTSAPTIGQWRRTLLQTLMTSVRWKQRGQISRRHFCVTKLSWDLLNNPDLPRSVHAALSGSGEDPKQLQLRLDASMLRAADDQQLDTLIELGETGLGLMISGAYAPLHARRHRDVLDIDYVTTPASDGLPYQLRESVERVLSLEMTPMVTRVDTLEDQILAVAAGARLGTGALFRSNADWSVDEPSIGGSATVDSEATRDEIERFINQ